MRLSPVQRTYFTAIYESLLQSRSIEPKKLQKSLRNKILLFLIEL